MLIGQIDLRKEQGATSSQAIFDAKGQEGANEPLSIGTFPFAALHDRYIYVDRDGIHQRKFGELVVGGWA